VAGLTDIERVLRYHDGTKHHFNRFAPSLGYLDWASQPRPFRSFDGAPVLSLYPAPGTAPPILRPPRVTYDSLFEGPRPPPLPFSAGAIGHLLRHALGLSAWKSFRGSRWSLRVNPSSGNLHPTEAYLITGPMADLTATPAVWHYAPDRHALEQRCAFDVEAWRRLQVPGIPDPEELFLLALTSIHWRESWKYGERAFRYCQHDLGHAVATLAVSAASCGWRLTMLPGFPQRAIAAMAGLDRDEDFTEAEREEPACLLMATRQDGPDLRAAAQAEPSPAFVAAIAAGRWFGRASQLSEDHVRWSFIDDVAEATEDCGRNGAAISAEAAPFDLDVPAASGSDRQLDAQALVLQRRSAVALDGVSPIGLESFLLMLRRSLPRSGIPWEAAWWDPRIHFLLFVHRVKGLRPGLYMLTRNGRAVPRLRAACRPEFLWEPAADGLPLWLLYAGDCRHLAGRLSCDQEIAADGFFSLGMVADVEASLTAQGASFYRHLFWESGMAGQVLYLEAEAAGARGTGIGCFYDDPVHEVLGLDGALFQSLYHFTIGMPVEDTRLTSEPGYGWEGG
jgi:SagB-type dehydrogenase family enzyme